MVFFNQRSLACFAIFLTKQLVTFQPKCARRSIKLVSPVSRTPRDKPKAFLLEGDI